MGFTCLVYYVSYYYTATVLIKVKVKFWLAILILEIKYTGLFLFLTPLLRNTGGYRSRGVVYKTDAGVYDINFFPKGKLTIPICYMDYFHHVHLCFT